MLVGRFCGLAVMIFRGGILAGDSNWPLDRQNWSLAYLNKYRLSILTRTPIVPTMVELRVKYFERGGFRAQWVSNAVNFEPYVVRIDSSNLRPGFFLGLTLLQRFRLRRRGGDMTGYRNGAIFAEKVANSPTGAGNPF